MNNNTVLGTLQDRLIDLGREEDRLLTILSERRILVDSVEAEIQIAQEDETRAAYNDEEAKNKGSELREHINKIDQERRSPALLETLTQLNAEQYSTFAKRQQSSVIVCEHQDRLNIVRGRWTEAGNELKTVQQKRQQIADEIHRLN